MTKTAIFGATGYTGARTGKFDPPPYVPAPVTLRLPRTVRVPVQLVDAVYGYQQPAVVLDEQDGVMLKDLLVGDWPLFVQVSAQSPL